MLRIPQDNKKTSKNPGKTNKKRQYLNQIVLKCLQKPPSIFANICVLIIELRINNDVKEVGTI